MKKIIFLILPILILSSCNSVFKTEEIKNINEDITVWEKKWQEVSEKKVEQIKDAEKDIQSDENVELKNIWVNDNNFINKDAEKIDDIKNVEQKVKKEWGLTIEDMKEQLKDVENLNIDSEKVLKEKVEEKKWQCANLTWSEKDKCEADVFTSLAIQNLDKTQCWKIKVDDLKKVCEQILETIMPK